MQASPGMSSFSPVARGLLPGLGRITPRSWLRLSVLLVPFAIGLGLAIGTDVAEMLTAERLKREILALGAVGSAGFLAAAILRPLFVVVSGSLFALAAGMVWGPWWGSLLALAGTLGSFVLVFGLARRLGTDAVRNLAGARWERLSGMARVRGFAFVFVSTLGFVFPSDLVVAVAASTGVPSRKAIGAAFVGSAPGTVAMALLGASAIASSPSGWWIATAAIVGLSLLALLLARLWFPRLAAGEAATG